MEVTGSGLFESAGDIYSYAFYSLLSGGTGSGDAGAYRGAGEFIVRTAVAGFWSLQE